MMGIVFLLAAFAGLLVSLLTGWIGIGLTRRAFAAGVSAWPLFWLIAAVVFFLSAAAIVAWLVSAARGTPPQAADFTRLFKAAFLFGSTPGIGMLVAGVYSVLR